MRITLPITDAARTMAGWQRQVPYALAQALNGTVLAARQQVLRQLPRKFIIRSNWVAKGLRNRFASKRDLVAVIGSKDPFMAEQELGEEKTAQGQMMAVPIGPGGDSPAFRGAGQRGKTLKSRWPSALPRTFAIHTKDGEDLILQRQTYKHREWNEVAGKRINQWVSRERTRVLYTLKKRVRVKARWGFRATVALAVGDVLGKLFALELASAIKGAR